MFNKKIKLLTERPQLILYVLIPSALIVTTLMFIDLMMYYRQPITPLNSSSQQQTEFFKQLTPNSPEQPVSLIISDLPTDLIIPEPETELTEQEKKAIAIPAVSLPTMPGADSRFRKFIITGQDNKFEPYIIAIRQGDIVDITLQASDQDYDLVIPAFGINLLAKQGEQKRLQFQANQTGSTVFYCSLCGGTLADYQGTIFIESSQ